MTDKIIIDGVDVSECEYINCCNKKTKCIILQDDICADSQYCKGCNCYYKQLKRTQNTLQDIKTLVTTDYIQIKRQLVQNYDCLDSFMQKIEDKCSEVID